MIYENQEYVYPAKNIAGVLVGILIGALAGGVTMLLLAPQSGKDTRMLIQKKGSELRDRTTEMVGHTVTKVRSKANEIAGDLQDRGHELASEQLDHLSDAVQAGKKAIQSS